MAPLAEADARRPIRRLLTTDASLTFLLISLFALLFVFYPLVEPHSITRYALDILSLLVLISGAYTVSDRRGVLLLCIGLAALTFVLQMLLYASPDRFLLLLRVVSLMLFLCAVTGAVLYKVLHGGRVTTHRIRGAIAVYLMLGLIWASAYSLILICDPASFDLGRSIGGTVDLEGIQTTGMSRLIYFSFVTMTTLGYGDITPQSDAADSLVILQALTGQIYLVVILARLVSLAVVNADRE
jgi:voltage-gated potassium channel